MRKKYVKIHNKVHTSHIHGYTLLFLSCVSPFYSICFYTLPTTQLPPQITECILLQPLCEHVCNLFISVDLRQLNPLTQLNPKEVILHCYMLCPWSDAGRGCQCEGTIIIFKYGGVSYTWFSKVQILLCSNLTQQLPHRQYLSH